MGKTGNTDKKKPVANVISMQEIYNKGDELKNPEYKMAYYICYLTGARITEALNMRARDVEFVIDNKGRRIAIFSLITEKRKDHPIRKIPVIYEDSTRPDLYDIEKKMIRYIANFINPMLLEERIFKTKKYNTITNYFRRHLEVVVDGVHKGKLIKGLSYKIHPHYLRHCRITHIRELYGFDVLDLKQFAGWTSFKMTDIYLHTGYKTLVEKMVKYG